MHEQAGPRARSEAIPPRRGAPHAPLVAILVVLGVREDWIVSVSAWWLSFLAMTVVVALNVTDVTPTSEWGTDVLISVSVTLLALGASIAVGQRTRVREMLASAQRDVELEQARRATVEERARIARDALRAGASGFLLKDSDSETLVAAVRTVHEGDALLAPGVTRRLIEHFVDSAPARLTSQTVFNDLTDREREVFEQMARGRSNVEIAAALFIAEQTAKTHVSRVMSKLGLRDRVHAVVLAYETGIVRAGEK